jgi:hypothetical protein
MRNVFSPEQIRAAVAGATSRSEALAALGRQDSSGNWQLLDEHIQEMVLPTTHWNSYSPSKERPLATPALKKMLKESGRCLTKCERCGKTEKQIRNFHKMDADSVKMTVHHKDENPANNDLTNLEVLCHVCHKYRHTKEGRLADKVRADELGSL